MSGAFEAAWVLLKADAHIGARHGGHFSPVGNIDDRYELKEPTMFSQGRTMRMNPLFGILRHPIHEKGHNMEISNLLPPDEEPTQFHALSPFEFRDGKMHYLGEDFDTRGFYRGMSKPRLQPDGTYVGVNVGRGRGGRGLSQNFKENFDEAAELFGSIAGHEGVHHLIDDEIKDWAKQQSGLSDAEKVAVAKKKEIEASADLFYPSSNSPFADVFADIDRQRQIDSTFASTAESQALKEAEERFQNLASIGHESGAYMLTPSRGYDNLQQVADYLAQAQGTYPAGQYTAEGGPGLSALHAAGPSEDQLRYQQKLQEQQSSVGVQ